MVEAMLSAMASTAQTVTFSSRDPYALAQWWAPVLDGRLSVEDEPGDPAATVLHRGTPLLGHLDVLCEQADGRTGE